jgi:hypothetical protein
LTHGYSRLTYAGWPAKDRRWVQQLPERLGPRRFRLLLSAWCRDLTEPWLNKVLRRDRQLREHVKGVYLDALEVSDRFADTGKSRTALNAARKTTFFRAIGETTSVSAIFDPLLSEDSLLGALDRCAMVATTRDGVPLDELVPTLRRYLSDLTAPEGAAGRIEPDCRDEKVLSLARSIYQERQFQRMPRLALALERAGCRNGAALAHCRAGDPAHHRGCWVLDRVLGKE